MDLLTLLDAIATQLRSAPKAQRVIEKLSRLEQERSQQKQAKMKEGNAFGSVGLRHQIRVSKEQDRAMRRARRAGRLLAAGLHDRHDGLGRG